MPTIRERFSSAWNAFRLNERTLASNWRNVGQSSYIRPDRFRFGYGSERTIVTAIYNRIAIDVSAIEIKHVKTDENGKYLESVKSRLNECLTVEANIDQTGRALIQDTVMSMCDEGVVALVPLETDKNPELHEGFDIRQIRCCKIVNWYPQHVEVDAYNEITGMHENLMVPKRICCIIENPLYSVMNEPNSTLQRLIRKLALLDIIDEQNGSGKLDLIIQLPYVIKSQARREQAEKRRKDIEDQLAGSKYGIAYTDSTERITQLNRAVENNVFNQIQYLTNLLYSQLGMSENIINGTASEAEILLYQSRTIEPFLSAIVEEIRRKWLSKTARAQGHSVMYFKNPFKLVPVEKVADIADKFTRNAILSSNEIRAIVGYKPSDDARADELSNKNLNMSKEEMEIHGNNLQNGSENSEQPPSEESRPPKRGSETDNISQEEIRELASQLSPEEIRMFLQELERTRQNE